MLKLTAANYYSAQANKEYMSASFIKSMLSCESRAMAELTGEWVPPPSEALLVGSYVDSYIEGKKSFNAFIAEHPEIFNARTGELKAPYRRAEEMIARAKQDKVIMEYLRGSKQKIATGLIEGVPFKAKFDVYKKGVRIVDLKTTMNMEPKYKAGQGKMTPPEYWGWDIQMAIYAELEGNDLPTYLAVITKEDPPDLWLIEITKAERDACMKMVRPLIRRYDAIKRGLIDPEPCGHCAYCRATKKIGAPLTLEDLRLMTIT
jgi:hypothetical protein